MIDSTKRFRRSTDCLSTLCKVLVENLLCQHKILSRIDYYYLSTIVVYQNKGLFLTRSLSDLAITFRLYKESLCRRKIFLVYLMRKKSFKIRSFAISTFLHIIRNHKPYFLFSNIFSRKSTYFLAMTKSLLGYEDKKRRLFSSLLVLFKFTFIFVIRSSRYA